MNAKFADTSKGTWAYIQKKVRIDGKSTTLTIKRLGLLSDIQKREGCPDPRQWVVDLAKRMTEEEKRGNQPISVEFYPHKEIEKGAVPLREGGDMMLLPLYSRLGLPEICRSIASESRAKYDLNEILQTLVTGRVLSPASKARTSAWSQTLVNAPSFKEAEVYRALSLLSSHIDDIQAEVYKRSKGVMARRDRVIYYDCTNYYFEIEDNDPDTVDSETGEFVPGLRKRGKSKEHRPSPIVQMGLFMDMDGIPLAFVVFPGNESEQGSLKRLEEVLQQKFGIGMFVVSTDSGLASEANRRYNDMELRDYICVQSLPSLKAGDQDMALRPEGWRIARCADRRRRRYLEENLASGGVYNLEQVLAHADEYEKAAGKRLLKDVSFYKEIIVEKTLKEDNPQWLEAERRHPGQPHPGAGGRPVPRYVTTARDERVIVTYSHDYALFLRHKREERLKVAEKIVRRKQSKPRQSQQSPLVYVKTTHMTRDGQEAARVEMSIDEGAIAQEARFDGFYAYGTSLDDDALDVLRMRSFHPEIEHLFRTTKTFLGARPVYLSRQERIKSHFLVCFLSMLILKMLQKQIMDANSEQYRQEPLAIDTLISALRRLKFGIVKNKNYIPMFQRTELTDQLQELAGVQINRQIITSAQMRAFYKKVKAC